jgi:hypothetical protein
MPNALMWVARNAKGEAHCSVAGDLQKKRGLDQCGPLIGRLGANPRQFSTVDVHRKQARVLAAAKAAAREGHGQMPEPFSPSMTRDPGGHRTVVIVGQV